MGKESQSDEKAIDERLRAVIADDDPFARRVIKDVLQRAGVIVIAEARDGRQAVELTLHYRPDVVVMDVVMPELDGIMATRQIRRELPEQLVIVLTGAGSDDDELGLLALRAGAGGFLSKDLEIEALPRALAGLRAGSGRDLAQHDAVADRAAARGAERLVGHAPGQEPADRARVGGHRPAQGSRRPPTRSPTSSCSRPRPSART